MLPVHIKFQHPLANAKYEYSCQHSRFLFSAGIFDDVKKNKSESIYPRTSQNSFQDRLSCAGEQKELKLFQTDTLNDNTK